MNTANALHEGWDSASALTLFKGSRNRVPTPTGFTAINQPSPELSSSHRSAAEVQVQQIKSKGRAKSRSSRRRNPTVASYLGLGDFTEPAHLDKYAPSRSSTTKPTRKRRARNSVQASVLKGIEAVSNAVPNQPCSFENSSMTKDSSQSIIRRSTESGQKHLPRPDPTCPTARQENSCQDEISHEIAMQLNCDLQLQLSDADAAMSTVYDDDDDDFGQLCFDFEPKDCTTGDEETQRPSSSSGPTQHAPLQMNEDDFDEDLMDEDLVEVASDMIVMSTCTNFQSSSLPETVSCPQSKSPDISADSAMSLDEKYRVQKRFVSPVTTMTRVFAATDDQVRKPIVRPAFPAAVRDRSPIIGMSPNVVLRTCFRIGEAINQTCQAVKTGSNIYIELYARVLNSERDTLQQRFTFCDLFHVKLPHIQATYAAAIWKSVRLFDYDSARLLQQGRICRCIGTMKRSGNEWTMTVLNIWEATWDDVEWVRGIIES